MPGLDPETFDTGPAGAEVAGERYYGDTSPRPPQNIDFTWTESGPRAFAGFYPAVFTTDSRSGLAVTHDPRNAPNEWATEWWFNLTRAMPGTTYLFGTPETPEGIYGVTPLLTEPWVASIWIKTEDWAVGEYDTVKMGTSCDDPANVFNDPYSGDSRACAVHFHPTDFGALGNLKFQQRKDGFWTNGEGGPLFGDDSYVNTYATLPLGGTWCEYKIVYNPDTSSRITVTSETGVVVHDTGLQPGPGTSPGATSPWRPQRIDYYLQQGHTVDDFNVPTVTSAVGWSVGDY